MTTLSIIGLGTAMLLLAATPGPGVFATVSKALSSGFRQAMPVVAGIVIGDLVFLLFAIYGLSMIAETFHALFMLIKYLGAAYLIWLGIRLWRMIPSELDLDKPLPHSTKQSFLGGLALTLGNPKVILFYLGFLPTFINLETLSGTDVVLVMLVVSLVLGSVMLFYAFAASRARMLFQNQSAQSRINKIAGSVMIATGATLLFRGYVTEGG